MENKEINNNPESQKDVNFETHDDFTVVENTAEKNGNKLPIIIIICVLVVALIAGIALYIAKIADANSADPDVESSTEEYINSPDKLEEFLSQAMQEQITNENGSELSREEYLTLLQQQLMEATTVLQQDVGSTSPNKIEEKTTAPTTTKPGNNQTETTTSKPQNTKVDGQIKAFFDRCFYIQGAFYSGNTGDPLYMSLDGENFEILTNLDGTELSILKLGDIMYIKRPAVNQYAELTKTFFDALGMDPGMMSFDFGDTKYEDVKDKFVTSDVIINGNPGICYSYKNADQAFKFYAEKDELRQIEILDANGTIVSQFTIDYFSETIPGDQLTLKGYTKTGMGTLFADMM